MVCALASTKGGKHPDRGVCGQSNPAPVDRFTLFGFCQRDLLKHDDSLSLVELGDDFSGKRWFATDVEVVLSNRGNLFRVGWHSKKPTQAQEKRGDRSLCFHKRELRFNVPFCQ